MVVIAVVVAFAAFLLLDWYWVRGRHRAPGGVRAAPSPSRLAEEAVTAPADLLFHPGHTWARVTNLGSVAVGCDEFAAKFAGEIAAVELPAVGSAKRQGDPAWTLISASGRRLGQVMPLEGEIVEVNRDLLEDPSLAGRAPYDRGWIARLRPTHLTSSTRNLLGGGLAKSWMDAVRATVTGRLGPIAHATAADGGEWAAGFGDHLDDVTWRALKRELFPSVDPETRQGA